MVRIAAFKRRSSQAARSPVPGSGEGSGVVTGVEEAAAVFAAASDQLIETEAGSDPPGIKAAMPRFLSALTALENSRSQSRRELTSAIWRAAEQNRRESKPGHRLGPAGRARDRCDRLRHDHLAPSKTGTPDHDHGCAPARVQSRREPWGRTRTGACRRTRRSCAWTARVPQGRREPPDRRAPRRVPGQP